MERFVTTLGPNGDVRLPAAVQSALGAKEHDKIVIVIENDEVRLTRTEEPLLPGYRSIPALKSALTDNEIAELATEEAVLDSWRK